MDDRLVWIVGCYIEDEWKEPTGHWSEYYFNRNSYSRWAAYEVLRLLESRGDRSPQKITEQFINKMDHYSCLNSESRWIFSIAREAAHEILDLLRAME